jgi:sugar porter (SP) family MFS transporter
MYMDHSIAIASTRERTAAVNFFLLRSAAVASLGGLLFGFDTAVISGATGALTQTYNLTPGLLGFTVSSALWGTVLGSIVAGRPSDRYGRVACLRALAVLYIVTAAGCGLAWNWGLLVAFRFIGGLAIGGSSVVGPMYIAEISPAAKRGRLVALFQFNVILGILLAYFSNYLIGLLSLGEAEWRWKLGIAALPSAFFLLALAGIPQSPRWLAAKGRKKEAAEIFRRIGEPDPDKEVRDVLDSLGAERLQESEPLFQRKYRLPVFLALTIGMFNQLSGINAILYYVNDIFARAGFDKISGDLQAVAIGATLLLSTAMAMSVIDKVGRKLLLLVGSVGTAICLAGAATIFATGRNENLLIWCLAGYMAFFGFSQGTVIWVYISEVFPNAVRAKGQSLGSFSHWFMNAVISGVFPLMAAASGAIPFVFFALMMLLQFVVVWFVYPETKGVSLEDMQKKMVGQER